MTHFFASFDNTCQDLVICFLITVFYEHNRLCQCGQSCGKIWAVKKGWICLYLTKLEVQHIEQYAIYNSFCDVSIENLFALYKQECFDKKRKLWNIDCGTKWHLRKVFQMVEQWIDSLMQVLENASGRRIGMVMGVMGIVVWGVVSRVRKAMHVLSGEDLAVVSEQTTIKRPRRRLSLRAYHR